MHVSLRRFAKFFVFAALLLAVSVALVGVVSAQTVDPTCTGSFVPNLTTAGVQGHVAQRFSTLRPAPGAPGRRVLAPADFTVVAPSTCVNGYRWVRIQYTSGVFEDNGQSAAGQPGYALESAVYDPIYGPGYWLLPGLTPPTPTPVPVTPVTPTPPVACAAGNTPYSFVTQFAAPFPKPGRIGVVFSTLRPAIGAADAVSMRVYKSSVPEPLFEVLETRAVGGFCWLHIRYTAGPATVIAKEGWALESQVYPDIYGAGRWLIPQ